jgi:hypothetical protein
LEVYDFNSIISEHSFGKDQSGTEVKLYLVL